MHDYPDRMSPEQARAFRDSVLNIVSQIPYGRVTTYGHIAALAGWPSHSRMVGRTLRYTPGAEKLPCHRVVNKEGRTAPGWSRQRTLLEEEDIHSRPTDMWIWRCIYGSRQWNKTAFRTPFCWYT